RRLLVHPVAAASRWRCSLSRLWVALISRHSDETAALPLRWKRSIFAVVSLVREYRLGHHDGLFHLLLDHYAGIRPGRYTRRVVGRSPADGQRGGPGLLGSRHATMHKTWT